mgnify:CR=1 FL=1
MNQGVLDWIALVLVLIGTVNWGLVALLSFDLVDVIFGSISWLTTIIYVLVALSGIWVFVKAIKK